MSEKLEKGCTAYATKDAIEQGILPDKIPLHVVRRNSKNLEMVHVTWDDGEKSKTAKVHEQFLSSTENVEHEPEKEPGSECSHEETYPVAAFTYGDEAFLLLVCEDCGKNFLQLGMFPLTIC